MAYVKIEFDPGLWVTKADSLGMYSIGHCLADDINFGRGYRRIDWILDERYDFTSSNRTFMEKFDGKIGVGDLFTEDPWEAGFVVPTPVMIDLLQQWDEVCKTDPAEVTIYYEDGRFTIEPIPRPREGN